MIVTGIKGTILSVANKSGTNKKGDYNFCNASFLDEAGKVFEFSFAKDLVAKKTVTTLLEIHKKDVVISLNLYPKMVSGYLSVGVEIVDFK